MIGRTGLAILVLTIGAWNLQGDQRHSRRRSSDWSRGLRVDVALVRRRTLAGRWLVAGVLALIALDAIRVLPDMETWRNRRSARTIQFWVAVSQRFSSGNISIFDNLPTGGRAQEANVLALRLPD